MGMRVRHGIEHAEEQLDARRHAERTIVAVSIDRLSINELQHEVWLAVLRDPRVDQVRDIGVCDPGKDGRLATDSRLGLTETDHVEELDGRAPFEMAVASLSEPDHTHAAVADRRYEPVGPKNAARSADRGTIDSSTQGGRDVFFEKAFSAEAVVLLEQDAHVVGERWILLAKRCHPR